MAGESLIRFGREELLRSIPDRFERIVRFHRDFTAVKTPNRRLSYADLNASANHLAAEISKYSPALAETAAVFLGHDIETAVAVLAVLKAGKICLIIDPSLPEERIEHMLKDSLANFVITESRFRGRQCLRGIANILDIGHIESRRSDRNPEISISPETPAFLFYTSGSTGEPKGVLHTHRSIQHFVMNCTNGIGITDRDRMTLLISCSSNGSLRDLLSALLNGAVIYPFDVKAYGISRLTGWMIEEKLTISYFTPTLFRSWARTLDGRTEFGSLRVVRLGGERVEAGDVDLFKKNFSENCVFVNGIGSTETSTFRMFKIGKDTQTPADVVPAGYELEDQRVVILDPDGGEVENGKTGEIAVRSRFLSSGYWRRPDLTEAAFRTVGTDRERIYRTGDLGYLLPDGCLICLGRKDDQVKIRGYRVEPRGIEQALIGHSGIQHAAVVAIDDKAGGRRLAAYLVSNKDETPGVGELRSYLKEKLPDYMIPADFIFLDSLPTNASGKIDKRALPLPGKTRPYLNSEFAAPSTPTEERLAVLFQEILYTGAVGANDNFFELGGDSLKAVSLVARLETMIDQKVSPSILYRAPTIRALGELLDSGDLAASESPIVVLEDRGEDLPFFCIPGNIGNVYHDLGDLARFLGRERPFYALRYGLDIPSDIESAASYYLTHIRDIQKKGPYRIGGICHGAAIAFEIARQLDHAGEKVAFLGMIEPSRVAIGRLQALEEMTLFFIDHLMRRFRMRRKSRVGGVSAGRSSRNFRELKASIRLKLKMAANVWAQKNYLPRPFEGPMTLFISEESSRIERRLRWSEFTLGGTRICPIRGAHDFIVRTAELEKDHLRYLAGQIDLSLNGRGNFRPEESPLPSAEESLSKGKPAHPVCAEKIVSAAIHIDRL
jgi:amino acid adenylation domain-containing protein